jgi:hypothetical protein
MLGSAVDGSDREGASKLEMRVVVVAAVVVVDERERMSGSG